MARLIAGVVSGLPGSVDVDFTVGVLFRPFAYDGEQFLDDFYQCPRGVRLAGVEVIARDPQVVEQPEGRYDERRQFQIGEVVFLLVEVTEEGVVGRAEQIPAEALEDPLEVTAGVFVLEIERFEDSRNQDAPFQVFGYVHGVII